MLKSFKKIALFSLCVGFISVSCEKENEIEEVMISPKEKVLQTTINQSKVTDSAVLLEKNSITSLPSIDHNLRSAFGRAVDASICGPTELAEVSNHYRVLLGQDLIPVFGLDGANYLFGLYMDLNFFYAYLELDKDEQYFGENGEYTQLVEKRQRDLERFWSMPNEIRVKGQHTATLNDREKLADLWEVVGLDVNSREEAYAIADTYLFYNSLATYLPDSPFFALDGFAAPFNLIVIGDGLVQMLSETGLDGDIVWTGILAHEWAHQIQFNNMAVWYPEGAADNLPEATRFTELEADFMAAYYMTHKRGATYNWKRVEQFNQLYFNIGDCNFEGEGHHGTPLQRMEASRLGYELAQNAQKQGHILTEQEVHEAFLAVVETIFE